MKITREEGLSLIIGLGLLAKSEKDTKRYVQLQNKIKTEIEPLKIVESQGIKSKKLDRKGAMVERLYLNSKNASSNI